MSPTPSDCPSPSDLQEFLAGTSSEIDQHGVAAHLETCAECRSQLDRWTEHDPESPTTPGGEVMTVDYPNASDRREGLGRLGPYQLLERIGQGGMGVVIKALDERLKRIVAVKMLARELADGAVAKQRFIREARAAAAVCDDHIVTIHAVDEIAGQPFIVMQLVAGESLQQKLDRGGSLPVPEVVRIGMQIASGLAAAHARGLVHRDIKPGNILIETGTERVRITDFGLARAVDDASLTNSGTVAGTPNFMSPEQARGDPIERTTDLFSLGSVLYAMCTGQPPFRAESTVAVLRRVSDDTPRPIRDLNPQVPDWLAAIIAKLMAKSPAERYQSASEVSDLLAGHLADLEQPPRQASEFTSPTAVARPRSSRRLGIVASALGLSAMTIGCLIWWSSRPGWRGSRNGASLARAAELPSPPNPPREIAKAVPRDPVTSSTIAKRAAEAAQKRDQKRALELFDEAIRRNPKTPPHCSDAASVSSSYAIASWTGSIADTTRSDPARRAPERHGVRAQGPRMIRSKAFRNAIDDATEAIRLDPNRQEAYVVRGTAYNGLGRWNHAIVDLDGVIRRAPEWCWNWFERATARFGIADHDRALSDVNRAIELDRSINQFWYLRGRIHTAKGDYAEARADLTEGIRLAPLADKYHSVERRGELESSFGNIDRAIADYTEAIRLRGAKSQKSDSRLFNSRANLYLAHGETDLALSDLDEARRLDPHNWSVLYHRGLALTRKRMFDQAIADFEAGRNLSRGDKTSTGFFAHFRADALVMAGRKEEGLAGYALALASDPVRGHPVLASRAWFIDRPDGDYDAALKKLDETATGGMIIQFLYRGLIYARLEMPDRALADFDELIKRVKTRRDWFAIADFVPRRLAFLIGRGEAHLAKGELDLALADGNAAVQFAPRSHEGRLLRARIHEKRGEKDQAEADRQEAAKLEPDFLLTFPKSATRK